MDRWSIVVLGDGDVGKTAISVRVITLYFLSTYDPTVEDTYRRLLQVDDRPCSVEVIDTAGQEDYETLRNQWIREGDTFILVYSVTSRETFKHVGKYFQSICQVKRGNAVFVLIGNKSDQDSEREVSREEGIALAKLLGCEFFETSAKTAQN
ncbi:hypothetical protein AGABI2DRAFT_55947, partial [Agaricus bisporus var. bisporus H97]|uniref:hypothetical protein n=1 Tax=Agaricus bisporus var. bisporus (strain H97 / ATCC MYA-4626 / FGSC 10389) TaxID=936046 RepID=UPI00029F6B19